MNSFLFLIQIFVSVMLIIVILLQAKGSGLSGVFGGENNIYRSKRGVEKFLIYLTIGLAVIFLVLSIVQVRL